MIFFVQRNNIWKARLGENLKARFGEESASWEYVLKTSSRHLEDIFSVTFFCFPRRLQDVLENKKCLLGSFQKISVFHYCDTGKKKKSMFLVLRRIQNLVSYLLAFYENSHRLTDDYKGSEYLCVVGTTMSKVYKIDIRLEAAVCQCSRKLCFQKFRKIY